MMPDHAKRYILALAGVIAHVHHEELKLLLRRRNIGHDNDCLGEGHQRQLRSAEQSDVPANLVS